MAILNDVSYDNFSFAANGLVLTNINHLVIASRNNQIDSRANRNGGVLVQSLYGTKTIAIEGYYLGTSVANAQSMYDTLAQAMNRQERILTVPHAGGTRSYTATPNNLTIQEPDGLNRLTFSFEFIVPDGSSEDINTTTLISSSVITTGTTSLPISVLGSVKARPLITLTFTSITGGTSGTVSIRNARDFIGVQITRNWITGDILTIDSDNFQIFVNGVLTAPVGRFPTYEPGTGSLYYSDTFTARSVTISATYQQKYL